MVFLMTSSMMASFRVLILDVGIMLGRDDHGMDALGRAVIIAHRHLGLAVGAQPRQGAVFSDLGQALRQAVGIPDGHGHEVFRGSGGIAEHQALVAGALLRRQTPAFDPLGDIRRLPVQGGENGAGFPIEAHRGIVIADLFNGLTDDIGEIQPRGGGDLSGNHGQAGGYQSFAGYPGKLVLGQDGI